MIMTTLKQSLILAAGVCLIACSPMSQEIDREILDEQELYESEKIENIELKIIAAKEDEEKSKTLIKIARLNISITEKRLRVFDLERLILKEQEKLYTFLNKPRKKRASKKRLEEIKDELTYQAAKLEYLKARQDDLKSFTRLKELELDLKISQRFLEQARMAQEFKEPETPDGSTPINISAYELSCEEKERAFSAQNEKREQTLAAVEEAEEKFKPLLKENECESVKELLER